MGRYTYEASKVNTSIDRLNDAAASLNTTESALEKAFAHLESVNGVSRCIDLGKNKAVITNLPNEGKDYINDLRKAIESKRDEIEDYNNAPWWKKIFSSIGLGISKFAEGLLGAVESIGDACVSLVGFVGGIFSKDFQNACGEIVKFDAAGTVMSPLNNYFDKYSYFSKDSTAANIIKGVGTAVGYVAIAAATGGATGLSSITANTIVAGVGGLGSGTEQGLLEGKSYNEAFAYGVKRGATDAALAYAGGKMGEKLAKNIGKHAARNDIYSNGLVTDKIDDFVATSEKTAGIRKVGEKTVSLVENGGAKVASKTSGLTNKLLGSGNELTKLGKVVNVGGKALKNTGNGLVNLATKNRVVGQVLTTGTAVVPRVREAGQESSARLAGTTVGDVKVKNIEMPEALPEPERVQLKATTTPTGSTGSAGGRTGGTVSSAGSSGGGRVSGYSAGGGSSSGGGSSYTPTAAPNNATPTKVGDVNTPSGVSTGATTGNYTPISQIGGGSSSGGGSTYTGGGSSSTGGGSSSKGGGLTPQGGSSSSGSSTRYTGGGSSSTGGGSTYTGSSGTTHGGGGYSSSGYSFGGTSAKDGTSTTTTSSTKTGTSTSAASGKGTLASSISSVKNRRNETLKINSPIDTTASSSSKANYVIPTAAALSASAAAGIGAKAYMDHKKNNENEEFEGDENNGYASEKWNGSEDDIRIDYGTENQNSLDDDDDYSYSADSIIEKYEASNRSELEEVQ